MQVAELEIYKTAYIFIRELTKIRSKMSRSLKYEVGAEMSRSALAVLRSIIEAARNEEKSAILHDLLTECEVLWTWVRLAHDLRGMTPGEFRLLCERLDELSRQGAAWAKWAKGQRGKVK